MTEGPFYPRRFPADSDGDLTRVAGKPPASGTPLEVTGVVMDTAGKPRANALFEVWQCDAFGQYHHVGEPEGSGDPMPTAVIAFAPSGRCRIPAARRTSTSPWSRTAGGASRRRCSWRRAAPCNVFARVCTRTG
jgi:hypothetical protein